MRGKWAGKEMVRLEELGYDLGVWVLPWLSIPLPPCCCEFKGSAMDSVNSFVFWVQAFQVLAVGAAGVTSLWGEDEAAPYQMPWDSSIKPTQHRAEPSKKADRTSGWKLTRKDKTWHGRGETKRPRSVESEEAGEREIHYDRALIGAWQSRIYSEGTERHKNTLLEPGKSVGRKETEKKLPCINHNSSTPSFLCSWRGLEVWRIIREKKWKQNLGKRGDKTLF